MQANLYIIVFSLFSFSLLAQDEANGDYNDTWRTPIITDEMTVDDEQNKAWRMGEYNYSAKPQNSWEIGIGLGHFQINGDVPADLPSGFGVALHLRKAINYILSYRIEGQYNSSKGLDGRLTSRNVLFQDNFNSDKPTLAQSDVANLPASGTYRNFHTRNFSGAASLIFNVGNLLFHKERNRWNLYAGVGLAITATSVSMDYYNGDNAAYPWDGIESRFNENSRDKRNAIKGILDGTYETDFENDRNVPGFLNDSGEIFPSLLGTIGVSRKFSKRVNISLETQFFIQDYDKWDGHEYRTTLDQTNDSDIGHFTNVRLAFNLGNFDSRTEPLYWLNPLDASYNDVANLKIAPSLNIADDDGDGVINLLDIEPGSDPNCPVDTRGVTLDSDGDGLVDCKDIEPFSPPGCPIDEVGVAQCEGNANHDHPGMGDDHTHPTVEHTHPGLAMSDCGKWYLPMIHFDSDQRTIKPEFYGHMHHVAEVMEQCPTLCVTVQGHTDSNDDNEYNNILSYDRANAAISLMTSQYDVDRSRFKLMYGGEEMPLIPGASTNAQKYMNRRVEFRTCDPGDFDMQRPGPETMTPSAPKNYFNGNKSTKY